MFSGLNLIYVITVKTDHQNNFVTVDLINIIIGRKLPDRFQEGTVRNTDSVTSCSS